MEKDALPLDSAALAAFVGKYATPPDAPGNPVTMEIVLEGGELLTTVPAARWTRRSIRASTAEKFFFLEAPVELTFERDAAGAVTAVAVAGAGRPMRMMRQAVVPPNR